LKTISSFRLLAALSPAAIFFSGCAKSDDAKTIAQNTEATAKDVATDVKTGAVDSWENIKDYTYDKREDFAAGLDRMSDKKDAEIQAINAKLAGLPDDAAKARDRTVKDYNEARADLKIRLAELRSATADTWVAAKEKVSEGWQRVDAAYDKVKSSPKS